MFLGNLIICIYFIILLFFIFKNIMNTSDHLPVLSKFALYLISPTVEDINKLLQQKINGTFCFSDIQVKYNFTEGISELDIKLVLPAKVKLSIYYFVNDKHTDSKNLVLKNYRFFYCLKKF